MLAKIFILTMMVLILITLGSGLLFLIKDDGQSKRTVIALTGRISLSLVLFCFLLIAFKIGWIHPHAII